MTVDKWAADQCGVQLDKITGCVLQAERGLAPWYWTITDPRCREIVREHFWLSTTRAGNSTILMDGNYWGCTSTNTDIRSLYKKPVFYGKTPAEAEIACINAIYQATLESGSRSRS